MILIIRSVVLFSDIFFTSEFYEEVPKPQFRYLGFKYKFKRTISHIFIKLLVRVIYYLFSSLSW